MHDDDPKTSRTAHIRWRALRRLDERLAIPMAVLGLVWLAIFIADAVQGLTPLLSALSTIIWLIFIAEFALRLVLAPDRLAYLRSSWLTIIALIVPAFRALRFASSLRVLRAFRAARATRGLRLVRAVTSFNRGLGAVSAATRRFGVWYVVGLALLVCFGGAAGMYALEPRGVNGEGFSSYGDALWWTAMIITTMGSAYWPRTPEGRVLAILISLTAIGIFGYLTGILASLFVGRQMTKAKENPALAEIRALRSELDRLLKERK